MGSRLVRYLEDFLLVGQSELVLPARARDLGEKVEVRIEERVETFLGLKVEWD